MSGFALSPQTYLREPMANLLSRIALFRVVLPAKRDGTTLLPALGETMCLPMCQPTCWS